MQIIPYLFNEFQRSKWESLSNLAEMGIAWQLFKHFANMDRPCCHVWKTTISFSNLNFSHTERDTPHYETLQTRIGLNFTRYHSLNELANVLPHALPYILSEICLVWGYWQRVSACYCYCFLKNITIYFFINLTVARGNALQIAPNHTQLR